MTTSFLPALQTSDYNSLRGTGSVPSYAGSQYASQCPNRVVFQAQLFTGQNGSVGSFGQEAYHNVTTGAYADALYGQRMLISSTNDKSQAYFTGRVRKSFDASNIYFNETSIAQTVDDYIYVLDDYPIMDRLLHYLTGSNEYFVDYDVAYRPLRPIIGSANDAIGLKSAYAGFISSSSSKFRISLSALFYPSQTAATITAWSLNYLDGTLISGSASGSGTTTGTITLDFPAGFRNILLTCTNSSGQSSTLAIAVWAEVRSGSATLITGFNGSQITLDVSSPSAKQTCSIDVFTDELQNTLDNTLICVWDEEYLNAALGSIGGNVRFLGRLRKEQNVATPDEHYLRMLVTKYTLEGPDTQLERLDPFNTIGIKEGSSEWGDVTVLTPYRYVALLLSEFTTFTNANVMSFDAFDDTFVYPAINTMGNSMLGILNDIGVSINAQMQFAPDGRASFVRHAFYVSNAQRNALTTVANWTDQDRTPGLNITFDEIRNVAQVDTWGGEWIGTPIVVPLHAQAPGLARDIGDKSMSQLTKQILSNVGVAAAQTELNDRAGCEWFNKALQRRLTNLTHPPGYGFLIPDTAAWYTWTISATDNLRNISYTTATRWILEKVSTTHDNKTGTKTVTPGYMEETNGIGFGNTIAITTSNDLPPDQQALALGVFPLTLAIVPPIEMSGPDAATLKSGISKLALLLSDGTITYTTNFNQTPPTWTAPVSLGVSGTVLRWVPDFQSGYYAGGGAGTKSYGWIVTTTGVYYGNINTPSFALGHTFRATSSLRSASASLLQSGHIVVVTDYSDGTYVTYATTGANWTAESSIGAGAGTLTPGCWYSQHTSGVVYASINGTGYKSTDSGATWSSFATIDPGADGAVDIAVPYPGGADSVFYYVKSGGTQTIDYNMLLSDNGWVLESPTIPAAGTWSIGQGWRDTFFDGTGGDPNAYRAVTIEFTLPATYTLKHFKATYSLTSGTLNLASDDRIWYNVNTGANWLASQHRTSGTPGPQGAQSLEWTGTQSGVTLIGFLAASGNAQPHGTDPGGSVQLTDITIDIDAAGTRKLMRLTVDVSPLSGYAPWKSQPQISISLLNGNIIGVAAGDNTETNAGIFISQDGGGSWAQLVAPVSDGSTGRYDWIPMSGNPTPVLYPAGSKGRIGYSASLAGPIVDKRGNLSTSASVIGLAGFRN